MPVLHEQYTPPTSPVMKRRKNPIVRVLLLTAGVLLLMLTPLVGPIPGPGGIVVFAAGLVLILQNSNWARRHFARLKKRYPRAGHYCDMALRRRSFRRRQQRAREAAEDRAEAALLGFPQESR